MKRPTRSLLVLCPIVFLAACGSSSEPDATADGTVATPTAGAMADAASVTTTPISYDCLPAQRLTASFDDSGATPKATLTLDGTIYELFATDAEDVRYVSEEGRTPGKTLVWFSKGEDGELYEGDVGGTQASETKIADCSPSDAPA